MAAAGRRAPFERAVRSISPRPPWRDGVPDCSASPLVTFIVMQTLPASTAAALANRWAPEALSLLRIVSAWLVLLHGSAKLLGWPKIDMFANVQ